MADTITLKPNEYLILAKNKLNFEAKYGDTLHVIGDLNFGLNKDGERVKLYDKEGHIVDSLTFYGMNDNDSLLSWNRKAPSHLKNGIKDWSLEVPRPGKMSVAYEQYLLAEAEKEYWKKVYFMGGGGFFFILVVGILSYRFSKKRRLTKHEDVVN